MYVFRSRLKIHKADINRIKVEMNKLIIIVDFRHIYVGN